MPPKPKLPTLFEIIQMNTLARRIQNLWVVYQYEKRHRLEREAYSIRYYIIYTLCVSSRCNNAVLHSLTFGGLGDLLELGLNLLVWDSMRTSLCTFRRRSQ